MKVRNTTLAAIIVAGALLAGATASATTITFSGLAGSNGTPVGTYTEGGFTITVTTGQFFQGQLFGNPVPSLFAGDLVPNDALDVTQTGGGTFNFTSVDLAALNQNVNYTLTGFLGGVQQYSVSGAESPHPFPGGFDTVINSIAGAGVPGLILASGGLLGWWRRRATRTSLRQPAIAETYLAMKNALEQRSI